MGENNISDLFVDFNFDDLLNNLNKIMETYDGESENDECKEKEVQYKKAELLKDTVFSDSNKVYKLLNKGAEVFIKEYINNDIVCLYDGGFCTAYIPKKDIKLIKTFPQIPIDAPVMYGCKFRPYDMPKTEKDCITWQFGYYLGDGKVKTPNGSSMRADYIVPFEKFNTKNLDANKEWTI